MKFVRFVSATLALLALASSACSSAEEGVGEGTLALRISGEGATKTGYPYEKNGATLAFVDGWQIRFDKYLVAIGDLSLRDAQGRVAFEESKSYIADLRQGDPEILRVELGAKRWDRFDFRITPPRGEVVRLNTVSDADVARMTSEGLNYLIEGQATQGGATYTFSWALGNASSMTDCTNGLDGTQGFVVRPNGVTEGEITVHADHMFWDSLGTENASLRFEAFAGASSDGASIGTADLDAQPLSDLRARDGEPLTDEAGAPLLYNVGSLPLDAATLGGFVRVASASQAHLNGLGLCTVTLQ